MIVYFPGPLSFSATFLKMIIFMHSSPSPSHLDILLKLRLEIIASRCIVSFDSAAAAAAAAARDLST